MKFSISVFISILLLSCQGEPNFTSNPADYNDYLAAERPQTTSRYFELWNSKITPDSLETLSFAVVSGEYNRYFQATGKVEYLKKAEQALERAVEVANIDKEAYIRSLARNYISQHRFPEALELAHKANDLYPGSKENRALLFDVHMELGNYDEAKRNLDSIQNMSDFGYLIRNAKWNDYRGDLDTTIRFMEKALARAESSGKRSLQLWSYTNLADYYGHAGRIQDSYEFYLKALEIDPQNAYAKKGIAWILFSYERKPQEAMRILDAIDQGYQSPDLWLLRAEIAEFMGNIPESKDYMFKFHKAADHPAYGVMYNVPEVDYYLEELSDYDKAFELAAEEVSNRPTPESYELLARVLLKQGQKQQALVLVRDNILGKTHEPGILLTAAEILNATGNHKEALVLKEELEGAVYELGPASERKIRSL
ncbi:Anaphase-promoting complex, cyclosome, subunit 3 [Robiginitalea myxolifaciens]|uniref:Anaphase-promoting complex, cyclosome, subunit 3 n=1 Tax=Robiginitalea myxolifaciens TaxID=400055 RepID=A0A1I6FMY9_9FLAO|nr:tetratricopeptide repeat protein [Robiginitalea myxolifaciens]SFR31309.1 Anaphase-promoting complex, cyclosome, subunit 3 [Robiginitalea myxolifaciens]